MCESEICLNMFLPKALFLSFPIEYSTNTIASAGAVWTFERSAEGLQGAESVGDGDVWHRRLRFNVTAQFDAIGSSAPHPRLGLADPEKETHAAPLAVTRKKRIYIITGDDLDFQILRMVAMMQLTIPVWRGVENMTLKLIYTSGSGDQAAASSPLLWQWHAQLGWCRNASKLGVNPDAEVHIICMSTNLAPCSLHSLRRFACCTSAQAKQADQITITEWELLLLALMPFRFSFAPPRSNLCVRRCVAGA